MLRGKSGSILLLQHPLQVDWSNDDPAIGPPGPCSDGMKRMLQEIHVTRPYSINIQTHNNQSIINHPQMRALDSQLTVCLLRTR